MRIVSIRGAGEGYGVNMCAGVVRGLDVHELVYPAEIRPIGTRTLGQSVEIGRAALRSIDTEGELYVIVAFSLGAYVASEFVMLDQPRNCKGLVLLGNPLRPRGHCAHGGVPAVRHGIAGEVPIVGVPVRNFTIPDDPISACPPDNGLRSISARVTGRRQPTPAQWWNAGATLDWLMRYLTGGRHTSYGTERMPGSDLTYVQAAAAAVRGML